MPYTISFSDPSKLDKITVPDMPPGINTVDTSLSLVGKGYPNYGLKIAENFVRLLENFASPLPPENPIEGQLWYDTSDPYNKVLKIMDGTATATRWPNANGIYQQGNDPADSQTQGLKIGDIWVDTAANQLKIWNSNQWTLVGPGDAGPEPTGAIPVTIKDTTNVDRKVILNKVNGIVVSIVSNESFTPKIVINGFTTLRPGVNLASVVANTEPTPIFNGPALSAQGLVDLDDNVYETSVFLRKNDQAGYGQIVTGMIKFVTPSTNNTLTAQGRDGIVINNVESLLDTNYVQFYKGDNDAIVLNNTSNGKIILKVKGTTLSTVLEVSSNLMAVTGSATVSQNLTVANTLTISSTATIATSIAGGLSVSKNITANGNINVAGTSTLTGTLFAGADIIPQNNATQNIGTFGKRFKQIYADIVGNTGSVFVGTFDGLARGLQQSTQFRIIGQITGTSVLYNGTSTTATFVTSLMPDAIAAQTTITVSTSSLNLLVLETADNSLKRISRDNFLTSIFPTGMIMPFGIGTTSTLSGGWVRCDGSEYDTTGATGPLFQLIGTIYGSSGPSKFNVPNLTTSTIISKNTIVATTVTSLISSGSTFISISSTSSIVTNLLVEGIASLRHQTVVTGIEASTVTISLQTLDVIPAGTVLSFSSATYLTYYIKL